VSELPLFEDAAGFDRAGLARKLKALAGEGVWIGTSSWKYEGWLGQIYSKDRYTTRGRFSTKRFQQECLAEYAEVFPAVGGDFSFYQFPAPEYWERLFAGAPAGLRWGLKAPEELTAKVFPRHARYGARAGERNESFLDAELFERLFLDALGRNRERVGVILFEFGTFSRQAFTGISEFLTELGAFLRALPKGMRYGVEIRNPEYLGTEYFDCLREHGAAHIFNAWTRMPEIGTQMRMPGAHTAGFSVVRALLRRGRNYEDAVKKLSPYRELQEVNEAVRTALRETIARAREKREPSYIFVNNRLEGNAPGTIEALVSD
jgi:uncharacterized protein YecE (DUF72 family)